MVNDRPLGSNRTGRVGTLVFLIAVILAAVITIVEPGRWRRESKPAPLAGSSGDSSASSFSGKERIADYLGPAACLECHPGESALQGRSGHNRTLRTAERSSIVAWLNGKSVNDPERPKIRWSYHVRDKRLTVDRTIEGRSESLALDYALGSGKHGVTFVAIEGAKTEVGPSGLEHRISYLADSPRLAMTPGQAGSALAGKPGDRDESGGFGLSLGPAKVHACFNCHATLTSTVARDRLEIATMLPNVSCERCHGPGRDHVEAARKGETDLRMRMGHDPVPSSSEVNSCGECHRLPRLVPAGSIDPNNPGIVRFQGVGISMSACYAKGEGELRCTTCHDPHDRASSEDAHYEAACLNCHRTASTQKSCPVSPAANCIGCHMPRREVRGNGTFTDHWIRKPSVSALKGEDPLKAADVTTSSMR